MTIAAAAATAMTFGAAASLLAAGIGTSVAGAGVNIGTSFAEASINSKEIEKAEKDLKEAMNNINDVNDTIQSWQNRKEFARVLYIGYLVECIGELGDPVKRLLQKLVLHLLDLPPDILREVARGIEEAGVQAGAQVARRAGAQAAGDVAQAGARGAGKLMIGHNAAFPIWDVIDLGFTIRDIVEDKGSEAAKFLRQKADELDELN